MFTDSHCHLASDRFEHSEVNDVLQRAFDASIGRIVTIGTAIDDWEKNLEIAQHAQVQATVGIHPCDVHSAKESDLEVADRLLSDARVAAVGETGLDYFHPAPEGWTEEEFRERQRFFLEKHFELAVKHSLNVVIHTRDRVGDRSFADALAIYQKYHSRVRAVFHCFIGTEAQALQVIEAGGVLSFGGVATFKKTVELRALIEKLPAGSFMLETDSPYLSPEPFRGKRNEPSRVANIAELIATCRKETLEQLSEHTETLVNSFFRWEL